ncbi:uncharacterized protein LOC110455418 [Mizuhopecten yessoensis]|uniref:uncharacterized protein LOC110455418 n=1 Tax=Mizuhopecten yessoensis TaxID=6573 RepID=UPI000B45A60D|nr:uncharacterized protein LOC110455418 [Mizuhopecten yessoensis]
MELVSGRLTRRFSTKEDPRCICVTASNHVIVGMTKHISKFTTDGGKPFYPRGVVYDSVGNLIIGDYHNNRVLLISGGGEFLRVIHTDTGGSWAAGIDREDVLWAVFGYSCQDVKLLQYSSV